MILQETPPVGMSRNGRFRLLLAALAVLPFGIQPFAFAQGRTNTEAVAVVNPRKGEAAQKVSGIVIDREDRVISNSTVSILPTLPNDLHQSTKTNEKGEFEFSYKSSIPYPEPIQHFGLVFKEGYRIASFNSRTQPIRVVLDKIDPTQPIVCDVVDSKGKPVAGAAVSPGTISFSEDALQSGPPREWGPFVSKLTNPDGRVQISSVSREDIRSIVVTTSESGSQAFPVRILPGETKPVSIRLKEAGDIAGRLLGPNGEPVAKAKVMCMSDSAISPQFGMAYTDKDGEFRLRVPVSEYSLMCSEVVDDATFPKSIVRVKSEASERVEMKAVPMGRVKGRFLDDQGSAITDAPLLFLSDQEERRFAVADANGNIDTRLSAGKWQVLSGTMDVVGYLEHTKSQSIDVVSGGKTTFEDIVVPTGEIIVGTIDGIDADETRIRIIQASVDDKPYAAYYNEAREFRLTVPRGTKRTELTDIQVRTVDRPVEVVSLDPFVVKVLPRPVDDGSF